MTQTSSIRADSISVAQPWASRSQDLADWAEQRLAHRSDSWVIFPPLYRRVGDDTAVVTRGTLTKPTLQEHFADHDHSHIVGLHCINVENTCKWLAFSTRRGIDSLPVNPVHARDGALRIYKRLGEFGIHATLIDCGGDADFQVWVLFDTPVLAEPVNVFAQSIVADAARTEPLPPVTVYPTGQAHNDGGWNTWLRIPGHHHCRPRWSRVFHEDRWLEGAEAVDRLLASTVHDSERFKALIDRDQSVSTMTDEAQGVAYDIAAAPQAERYEQRTPETTFPDNPVSSCLPEQKTDEALCLDDGLIEEFTDVLDVALEHEPAPVTNPSQHSPIPDQDQIPCAERSACGAPKSQHKDVTTTVIHDACDDQDDLTTPNLDREVVSRIETYLAKVPTGLHSGQGRNTMAFRIASFLIHEIGLTFEEALPLTVRWNEKNLPPLETSQLEHIILNISRLGYADDELQPQPDQAELPSSTLDSPPATLAENNVSDASVTSRDVAVSTNAPHNHRSIYLDRVSMQMDHVDAYTQRLYSAGDVIEIAGAFSARGPQQPAHSRKTTRATDTGLSKALGGGLRPGEIVSISSDQPQDQSAFAIQLADGIAAHNIALRDFGSPIVPVLYIGSGSAGFSHYQRSITRMAAVPQEHLNSREFLDVETQRAAVEQAHANYRHTIAPYLAVEGLVHTDKLDSLTAAIEHRIGQLKQQANANTAVMVIDPIEMLWPQESDWLHADVMNQLQGIASLQQVALVLLRGLSNRSHGSSPQRSDVHNSQIRRLSSINIELKFDQPPHSQGPNQSTDRPIVHPKIRPDHPGSSVIAPVTTPSNDTLSMPTGGQNTFIPSHTTNQNVIALCYPYQSRVPARVDFTYDMTTGYFLDVTRVAD